MDGCEGITDHEFAQDRKEKDSTKENKESMDKTNMKPAKLSLCMGRPSMTPKCDIHHYLDLEYYCPSHDKVVCETCVQISHRTCNDIDKISELSVGVSVSNEFEKMIDNMKTIEQYCDKNFAIVKDKLSVMKATYKEAMKHVEEVFQKLYRQDKEKLDSINKTSEVIHTEIKAFMEELKSKDDKHKFIMMKKINQQIIQFSQSLASARRDVNLSNYGFIPAKTNGMCSNGPLSKTRLGQICIFPVQIAKIKVETQSDRHYCSISGICLLPGGKLVIADNGNKKIKLFSKSTKDLLIELPVETTPLALTRIDDQTVIMASATDKQANVLNVKEGTIEITNRFELDGICQNIGVNSTKYAVSFNDSEQALVLNSNGDVLKKLEIPSMGSEATVKSQPKAIAFDLKNEVLYIAFSCENKVAMFDLEGDFISHFEAKNMNYPISIALGRTRSIYVCCRGSENIFYLSRDLSIGHEILNEDDGLVSPWCISVCAVENVLYVGSYGSKYVQIFKL